MSTLAFLLVACGGGEPVKPTEAPKAEPVAPAPAPEAPKAKSFDEMSEEEQHAMLMTKGKEVYEGSSLPCSTCHQADGKGQEGVYPPLVGQKDHMGDCVKHAAIVIYGLNGKMVVDGKEYDGAMTPQGSMLDDMEIAAVISYERMSWGNDYGFCKPSDVATARTNNPLTPATP